MKSAIAVIAAFLLCSAAVPARAASPADSSTHPKPHKVKRHKRVKHPT